MSSTCSRARGVLSVIHGSTLRNMVTVVVCSARSTGRVGPPSHPGFASRREFPQTARRRDDNFFRDDPVGEKYFVVREFNFSPKMATGWRPGMANC